MTIVVVVGVPEGIVFAGESRGIANNKDVQKKKPVIIDTQQKVYELGPKFGAVTVGMAYLVRKSIEEHIKEFKISIKDKNISSVREISYNLSQYFTNLYENHINIGYSLPSEPIIRFFVGGYEVEGGSIYHCSIPKNEVSLVRNFNDNFGAYWAGNNSVICRLLKGFDPNINKLDGFSKELENQLYKLNYIIRYDKMSLQKAIEHAIFLIKTTIDILEFSDGTNMSPGTPRDCGGLIDVAVIEPNKNFNWIYKKR